MQAPNGSVTLAPSGNAVDGELAHTAGPAGQRPTGTPGPPSGDNPLGVLGE